MQRLISLYSIDFKTIQDNSVVGFCHVSDNDISEHHTQIQAYKRREFAKQGQDFGYTKKQFDKLLPYCKHKLFTNDETNETSLIMFLHKIRL